MAGRVDGRLPPPPENPRGRRLSRPVRELGCRSTPLSEWGKVLHDEDLAAAIRDRVLERGRFVHLDGPSGRTRHLKLEQVLPSKAERLRISGINGSEFPEPTVFTP